MEQDFSTRQLRAMGMTKDASDLRKKWRRLTKDYEIYSLEHGRAFYRYRCAVDSAELQSNAKEDLTEAAESGTIKTVTFQPAETVEEAEQYAKKFAESVSFTGVKNIDSVNAVNETLTRLTEKYPISQLSEISVKKLNIKIKAQSCGGELKINRDYINAPPTPTDWEKIVSSYPEKIAEYQRDIESGQNSRAYVNRLRNQIAEMQEDMKYHRFSVSSSSQTPIQATISHEYGHILADQLFGQINATLFCTRYNSTYFIREMIDTTFRKARDTGDVYLISKYANKNAREFFAECFAAKQTGETLPEYIEKTLEEALKRR